MVKFGTLKRYARGELAKLDLELPVFTWEETDDPIKMNAIFSAREWELDSPVADLTKVCWLQESQRVLVSSLNILPLCIHILLSISLGIHPSMTPFRKSRIGSTGSSATRRRVHTWKSVSSVFRDGSRRYPPK